MSVAEAAAHVGRDASWLHKGERAELAFRRSDVAKLLDLYGRKDAAEIETVLAVATDARKLGWWQRRYGPDALPEWFTRYIGLERGASRIELVQSQLIHGLFQTPEYAHAILANRPGPINPSLLHERVAIRMERQVILAGDDPTPVTLVLDESALHRRVGTVEVMAAQLFHLAEMSQRPTVDLRILPFAAGVSSELTFAILSFPQLAGLARREEDDRMVYVGVHTDALYLEEPPEVASFAALLDDLQAAALSRVASTKLLTDMAERGIGTS